MTLLWVGDDGAWRRARKIALIEATNPVWADLSRDWYDYEPADYRRALDRMDS